MLNNTENTTLATEVNLTELDPNAAYGLDATQNNSESIAYFTGGFGADYFTFDGSYDVTIYSGNGNIDYGFGYQDTLDLSHISVEQVVGFSLVNINGGGEIFNVGNGDRAFDYLELADGSEILFEGLDQVVFSNQTIDLTVDPNDPGFSQQWGLHMMGVHNVWGITAGSNSVLIGVQDTGLAIDNFGNYHQDIKTNTLTLTGNTKDDFYREAGANSYSKTSSHGTAVQGIIAANSNNGSGIAGINWGSDVANLDVLDGNLEDLTSAQATQLMIDQAASQGQNLVINMSFGVESFGATNHPNHAELEQVVAANPNTLFVIAAGNSGNLGQEGIASPAILAQAYDNVIAVGASWGYQNEFGSATEPGTRIEYDGYWGSQYGAGLTLMGPSEVITTDAFPDSGFGYSPAFNGTSAATPNVTGVASLVWSANSNLTAADIKQILSETATDLGQAGYDIFHGHGFVNADAAVRRAIALKVTNSNNFFGNSLAAPLVNFSFEEVVTLPETNSSQSVVSSSTEPNLEVINHFGNEITTSLFDYEAAGMGEVIELNPALHPELVADVLAA